MFKKKITYSAISMQRNYIHQVKLSEAADIMYFFLIL